jgi:hypothetical protein
MPDKPLVETSVQETMVNDLNDLFGGAPGAANVVTATEEPRKPNIFSNEGVDLSFLDQGSRIKGQDFKDQEDKEQGTRDKDQGEKGYENKDQVREHIEAIVQEVDGIHEDEVDGTDKRVGRPKTDKSGVVDFFKKQIESGRMLAFDDYDEQKEALDVYLNRLSQKDLDELWEANHAELSKKSQAEVSQQFFESLPTELQYAYKYVADGGQDLKGLFQALSQAEEVRSLNVEDENDQERIYRQYLSAINFGNPEEIEEEVMTWKDLGQLDKKAKQAKPKLDKMQEQIMTQRLQQQEQLRQQEEAAAQAYVEHVYHALEPGEINGLKLDKKTQSFLYNAMVSAQYPSITGKPTNLLGHLLEKYQFVEPNYPLLSEALWLLSDPQGYREHVKVSGANEVMQKTVRALKTEESRKLSSSGGGQQEEDAARSGQKKLAKPGNIFKRA